MPGLLIIAALEREIAPLVRTWNRETLNTGTNTIAAFRSPHALAVCAGVGPAAAARAARAGIAQERPEGVISTGFAGALEPSMVVGTLVRAATILDAQSGRSYETGQGKGVLLSVDHVLGSDEKQRLAARHHAQAVDMEAAAVAEVAKQSGVAFMAVKAISDEIGFPIPDFGRFTSSDGKLEMGRLLGHAAVRPAMWPVMFRLWRNTRRASLELCRELPHLIEKQGKGPFAAVTPGEPQRELKSH